MRHLFEAMDQHPIIPVGALAALLLLALLRRAGVAAMGKPSGGLLGQTLFWWSPHDPFTVRDLLRSIAIFGASGSGKSSGSGYQIAKNIVRNLLVSGIILASKPEDRAFWEKIFAQAGRGKDLLVFGPDSPLRFNFLDFLQQSGADTRDITQAVMVIGETLDQSGGGRQSDPFWHQQNERLIYNAVEIVLRATGKVTAPDMQRFINGAAQNPTVMATPEWQSGFHNGYLRAAYGNLQTAIQRHDYALAAEYWLKEYPAMNDLLFPRLPMRQAARLSRRSAAAWISGSVRPGRRTARISPPSNSRRHARRLSA